MQKNKLKSVLYSLRTSWRPLTSRGRGRCSRPLLTSSQLLVIAPIIANSHPHRNILQTLGVSGAGSFLGEWRFLDECRSGTDAAAAAPAIWNPTAVSYTHLTLPTSDGV